MNGRTAAALRALGLGAAGVVVVLTLAYWIVLFVDTPGDFAFDFRQFWQGGRDVVDGVSPYPAAGSLPGVTDELDAVGVQEVFRFPYPAFAALALAPFGAMPFDVASWLWAALLFGSFAATLGILGVRDWRVYAVVGTSVPVLSAVRLGTLTPLLVLALAVMWRWRDRRWIAGASLAVAISLKLFLWPLAVWLAATRRFAAAAIAFGGAAILTLGAWAAIGFDGIGDYPELVRRLADVVSARGYSLVALGEAIGLPERLSAALPWAVGLPFLAVSAFVATRLGRERLGFTLALVAAVALTPIVWLHYVALLVVPLAVSLPDFTAGWALLWVFWLAPASESDGALWRIGLVLALVTGITYAAGRAEPPRERSGRPAGSVPGLSKPPATAESGG